MGNSDDINEFADEMTIGLYLTFSVIFSIISLIICIIYGYIALNFLSFIGTPLDISASILIFGLIIIIFPKVLSNKWFTFLISLGFSLLNYGFFTKVLTMLLGSKFVSQGELHGIFGITTDIYMLYLIMTVFGIIIFAMFGAFKRDTNFHNKYKDYNVIGEWFEMSEESINEFKKECERFQNIIDSLKENPYF